MPAGALLAFGFVFGLLVGSFLNVVIHRVPRGESVVRPRSRCPGCERTLSALENVPLFSWLVQRGRCRGCGMRISARYPAIEGVTGLLFAAIAVVHGVSAMTPLWWVFAALLVAGAVIDFDERWIPDSVTLGGLVLGLLLVPVARAHDGAAYLVALEGSLLGAALGGGLLWIVGFLHARVSVALGRTFEHWPGEGETRPGPGELDYWIWFPGLGFGDVKLMAMVGSFLGPFGVVQVILLAAVLGLVLGGLLALRSGDSGSPFGFGPAIAAAALLACVVPIPWPALV
jgi:leader peptidase (prepilin peptidase)/N-methyltransferase